MSTPQTQFAVRPRPASWTLVFAVFAASFFFAAPAAANTSVFTDGRFCTVLATCRELSEFGVLTGVGAALQLNGGWTFNGGIAVNTSATLKMTGTDTANDIVDFADTIHSGTTCGTGGVNKCGTLTGTTPVTNHQLVTDAYSAFGTILTDLSHLSSATAVPVTGSVNIESGTTPGSIKVYKSATYTQTGALTIGCGGTKCNANDFAVFDLSGTSSTTATFKFNVNLADGLSPDQVIFYLPTANLSIAPTAAAVTINADFFLNSGTYTIGCSTPGNCKPVNLYGRVMGGQGTLTFNSKGGTQDDPGPVPEPATWAMMAGGLGAALWLRHRTAAPRR